MSITELIDSPANDIPVPFFTYRSTANPLGNDQQHNVWRASASYVTGSHSMKVGYQAAYQVQKQFTIGNPNMISYTFFGGAPSTLTQYIPSQFSNRTRFDAIYVQDQWTVNRFTVQGGIALRARVELVSREARTARSRARVSCRMASSSRNRTASRATTTSPRAWVWRTTSSATARLRSR